MSDALAATARSLGDKLSALAGDVRWRITATRCREHQVYYTGADQEAVRIVEDHGCDVELHLVRPKPDGAVLGTAGFHVLAGEPETTLDAKVEAALAAAGRVENRLWRMPGPGPAYPAVDACAEEELARPADTLREAAEIIIEKASTEPRVAVSHFEIVLQDDRTRLWNSEGLDVGGRSSLAVLHMVLVAQDRGKSFDIKQEIYRRRVSDFDLARVVEEDARFARDTLSAELPSSGTRPVVISHGGLDFLFQPILAHGGGEFHFEGVSRFRKDEPIVDEPVEGDRLSLVSDGLHPMGIETRPCSEEGLPPTCIPILDQNVFRTVVATAEFAGALALPATGPATNLIVEPGDTSLGGLLSDGPLLHVVEFSALLPDKLTGDFTGEIRLGYEIGPEGSRPVKGGAVSGNLFAAMNRMRLSREKTFRGNYLGPAAVRFEDLTVSGR